MGITVGITVAAIIFLYGLYALIQQRRRARQWNNRTKLRFSIGGDWELHDEDDIGPASGRLQPKEDFKMDELPVSPAIPYSEGDDIGHGARA